MIRYQGEMASGMIVDFNIDPDLVGIAIGKKGARIKQVEKDSGVSSVNVDGKSGVSVFLVCVCVWVLVSLAMWRACVTVTASPEYCKIWYEL
jgi:KH domain